MRVGLDLLFLVPGETGGRETYARELVRAMLESSAELDLVAFVNRDAGAWLATEIGHEIRSIVLPISARSRVQWALGELALVAVAARRERVEVLHSMANFAPVRGRFRRVVTIHDLQYRALPDLLSSTARVSTAGMIRLAGRRAERVITGSHTTAREIVEGLGVDASRIDVISHGSGSTPGAEQPMATELRRRHGLADRQVILCPASNLPHKNLPALLHALALLEPVNRPALVLAGHGTESADLQTQARAGGVDEHVRGLGTVSTGELEGLYALAACVVLPTLYEGFGLPVLEAMVRGVPVVCSDLSVLREVAGPAALYFDPNDPADIASKIDRLLADVGLADRLRELGIARGADFSWSAAAAATLASYRRALENGCSEPTARRTPS
ncbi:MAG TPA: glycosyltransferase family 1 protein [Solirubrobacteraceae bacterium]|nr:glycosyltransferase family 1 protein [Solirubrobacteraceae bacterium]